jgi:hypothetical protein
MVQLSATKCRCIAILWVVLVSFATITLCVASQRVVPKVSACFFIDSVRKRLDTPWYFCMEVTEVIVMGNNALSFSYRNNMFFALLS